MKHKIEVNNPTTIAGDREWMRAFGKIRDEFIAGLKQQLRKHAVRECWECDSRGKPREALSDDVPLYLSHMIDDGIPVAYAVCKEADGAVLWFCAADELQKAPAWPGDGARVLCQDAHFGAVAVKRTKRALPIDERFFEEAERELNVQLPASYKARMAKANGGEIQIGRKIFVLYPIFDKSDRKSIRRTAESLTTEAPRSYRLPRFPSNALAIGADDRDIDRLVLLKQDDGVALRSEIYCWTYRTGKTKLLAEDIIDLER